MLSSSSACGICIHTLPFQQRWQPPEAIYHTSPVPFAGFFTTYPYENTMFLLSTENARIVSFDTLLTQAMSVAPAEAPSTTALSAQQTIYSPPIYEEVGDDDWFSVIEL